VVTFELVCDVTTMYPVCGVKEKLGIGDSPHNSLVCLLLAIDESINILGDSICCPVTDLELVLERQYVQIVMPRTQSLQVGEKLLGGYFIVPRNRMLVPPNLRVFHHRNDETSRPSDDRVVGIVINDAGEVLHLFFLYFEGGCCLGDAIIVSRWSGGHSESRPNFLIIAVIPEDCTRQVVDALLRVVGDGIHNLTKSSANPNDIGIAWLACNNFKVIERALEKERNFF